MAVKQASHGSASSSGSKSKALEYHGSYSDLLVRDVDPHECSREAEHCLTVSPFLLLLGICINSASAERAFARGDV